MPWFGKDTTSITALQHRFLDPSLEKGERYTLKPGSQPLLFGLQAFGSPLGAAQTLFVVEGEYQLHGAAPKWRAGALVGL